MLAAIISILIVLVIILVVLKSWATRTAQPTKYVWHQYPGASFFHEPPIPRQGTP